MTVGLFDDGTPGEVWIDISKTGSALRAWTCSAAMFASVLMQNGTPLVDVVRLMRNTHNEFNSSVHVTGHKRIVTATGVLDAVAQLLEVEYIREVERC